MEKRILAITAGDPAGIGPEVVIKALQDPDIYEICQPIVIGDGGSLRSTAAMLGINTSINEIRDEEMESAFASPGRINFIQAGPAENSPWELGKVSKRAGQTAFLSVEKGIKLAMGGKAAAVVTAPINKEAINLAGYHYSGHTEIFSAYTGTKTYGMLLISRNLKVIHVTTHMSMREACDAITEERVLKTIRLAQEAARLTGENRKIAVAGLNAHCSENGLFGREEIEAISPAICRAQKEGIEVEGPIPADTVFVKAAAGQYGIVVAMYHDQGHIPVKMDGFHMDPETGEFESVSGINCTIGLPIIRTSVDHGTAFDRAGKGVGNENSMIEAIKMAVTIAEKREEGGGYGKDVGHCR